MAVLRTDYVDDVLDTSSNTKRKYDMTNNGDGTVSFTDVSVYAQEGDTFGGIDINKTNSQVNANTTALGGISFSYNSLDNHFYATDGTHTKKLGSADGSATTAQVLEGATFGSAQYDDTATGTMPNKGKWITATTGKGNVTIPEGYHNGQGYVSGQGAYDAGLTYANAEIVKALNRKGQKLAANATLEEILTAISKLSVTVTFRAISDFAGYTSSGDPQIQPKGEVIKDGVTIATFAGDVGVGDRMAERVLSIPL